MSTSCILVRANKIDECYSVVDNFVLEAVRVNYDGYPEYMLKLLNSQWKNENEDDCVLSTLFDNGEIRALGSYDSFFPDTSEFGVTQWYGNGQSFSGTSMSKIKQEAGADYIYFYHEELKCWI